MSPCDDIRRPSQRPRREGRALTEAEVARIIEAVEIGAVHPHDLRHTLATKLFVVDRWTVPQVQAYLGHADPTVTLKVYTHVAAEELPRPSGAPAAAL